MIGIRRAAAALVLAPAIAAAQSSGTLVPRFAAPAPGGFSAEASLDAVNDPVYADARGVDDELAHSLRLYRFGVTVTYGLSASFGAGAIVEGAENRYCCINGRTLSDSGLAGIGAFVDWTPRSAMVLRLGYEARRGPDESPLPVSDGQDRVFLQSDLPVLPGLLGASRLAARVDVEYGRPFEIQNAYFRAYAEIAPRFPVFRSAAGLLDFTPTAGFSVASDARENGTIFHNRRSTTGRAGAELRMAIGGRRENQVIAQARRDFASRNAISGWRIGLTFRRLFGGRSASP